MRKQPPAKAALWREEPGEVVRRMSPRLEGPHSKGACSAGEGPPGRGAQAKPTRQYEEPPEA